MSSGSDSSGGKCILKCTLGELELTFRGLFYCRQGYDTADCGRVGEEDDHGSPARVGRADLQLVENRHEGRLTVPRGVGLTRGSPSPRDAAPLLAGRGHPVTHMTLGENVGRAGRVLAQLASEPLDDGVDKFRAGAVRIPHPGLAQQ